MGQQEVNDDLIRPAPYKIVLKTFSKTDFAWRIYLPKHADHAAGYSAKITLTVK